MCRAKHDFPCCLTSNARCWVLPNEGNQAAWGATGGWGGGGLCVWEDEEMKGAVGRGGGGWGGARYHAPLSACAGGGGGTCTCRRQYRLHESHVSLAVLFSYDPMGAIAVR